MHRGNRQRPKLGTTVHVDSRGLTVHEGDIRNHSVEAWDPLELLEHALAVEHIERRFHVRRYADIARVELEARGDGGIVELGPARTERELLARVTD